MLPVNFYNPGEVLVDSEGNAVVISQFALNSSTPMGVLKFDSHGTLLWSDNFIGPARLAWLRRNAALSSLGDLVICGGTDLNNSSDAILTCVGGDGTLRWNRTLPGTWDESFDALDIDHNGTITVAGNSSQYEYNVPREIVTMRYSREGQELWRSRYSRPDSSDSDTPASVRVASDDSVYVAATRGSWPGPYWVTIQHYSSSGELLWDCDFRGSVGESAWAGEARIDREGNFIVLSHLRESGGTYDILTLCYRADGSLLSALRQPGPNRYSEQSRFLDLLAGGDMLISAAIYPGPSYEFFDSMFLRADSDGRARWTSRQLHPHDLSGEMVSVFAMPDGGFLTAGWTSWPGTRSDAILQRFGTPPPDCGAIDPCPGDLNSDCRVDISDLTKALSGFGNTVAEGFAPANGDADLDGDIDIQDLVIVLSAWAVDCR